MTLYTIMRTCPFSSTALRTGFANILRRYGSECVDDRMCRKGYLQSPIDISSDLTEEMELPPLCFAGHFESNVKLTLSQQMNTISIVPKSDCPPKLQGGPLTGTFFLDQVLFRWGTNDRNGTEHSINQSKAAMEVQLLYYNCMYGLFKDALNQPNGVAIIGLFLLASPDRSNQTLDELLKCLCLLNCPGASVTLTRNTLKIFQSVLDTQEYFTYEGSLTYPPCTEEVIWMVFKKAVAINCSQVVPFRNICDQNGNKICSNTRELQQLNGRTTYDVLPCPVPDDIAKKNVKQMKTKDKIVTDKTEGKKK